VPDSPATVTLQQACRAGKDLVRHRVAVTNQLRAHLPRRRQPVQPRRLAGQPGAPGPLRLPGPGRLALRETPGRLAQGRRLQRPHHPAELYRRLTSAPRGPSRSGSAAITCALAAVLASLNTHIKALETQIGAQLADHADAHVFTSLPRSGTVRAARLLSEIGDCRARFPDPESLSTATPSPAAKTTPTRSGSSPGPGCT
jgi:transposase